MRLFDHSTDALREVEIRPRMTVYVCGITPYDAAHLGHAFTYVQFDVLVRYLRHLGAQVEHAQNVTDVDDDILRVARERGVDFLELAEVETAAFERTMEALGVVPPTYSPRATAFVPEMVEEVRRLLDADHAYVRDGTVYFRVASDASYGRLSRYDRETMITLAKERGGHPEDPAKDDPLDFVLWQPSAPDEPSWDSPWGRGRPGWHIECSTMARRLLGQPVDIHGGGTDLVFPHHESELAQAEGVPSDRPFVRHWVHTGMVDMDGSKMSKSLGNLVFATDLLERYAPAVIRRVLLSHHYREDWEYDEDAFTHVAEDGRRRATSEWAGADAETLRRELLAALDDDLDTPRAMAVADAAAASSDPAAAAVVEESVAVLGLDV